MNKVSSHDITILTILKLYHKSSHIETRKQQVGGSNSPSHTWVRESARPVDHFDRSFLVDPWHVGFSHTVVSHPYKGTKV